MVKTLRWWLTVCVLGVLVYFSYANGWLLPLYEKDATMITYLITVIFGATTLSLGYKSFLKINKKDSYFYIEKYFNIFLVILRKNK